MEEADFFLPLLDPNNEAHSRYLTCGTNGSFQLIYGFCKPCIIQKKFASPYKFNDSNSIIYNENSEFGDKMLLACRMTDEMYLSLQNKLKNLRNEILQQSLKNFLTILY